MQGAVNQSPPRAATHLCHGGRRVLLWSIMAVRICTKEEEEEEEERDLINDLKRYGRLAVAWNRHGSPVPRWTLTRYGPDDTPTLLALHSTGYPPPPSRERGPP